VLAIVRDRAAGKDIPNGVVNRVRDQPSIAQAFTPQPDQQRLLTDNQLQLSAPDLIGVTWKSKIVGHLGSATPASVFMPPLGRGRPPVPWQEFCKPGSDAGDGAAAM
jgi:hypothetical protein